MNTEFTHKRPRHREDLVIFGDVSFHRLGQSVHFQDIELIPADDSVCRLVFVERETEKHTYSVQDGTLTIGKGETGSWYEQGSLFTTGEPSITLYLPKTAYASLFIEEHTGAVLVPKDFSFGSVSIFVTTGDVDCSASSSGISFRKAS